VGGPRAPAPPPPPPRGGGGGGGGPPAAGASSPLTQTLSPSGARETTEAVPVPSRKKTYPRKPPLAATRPYLPCHDADGLGLLAHIWQWRHESLYDIDPYTLPRLARRAFWWSANQAIGQGLRWKVWSLLYM
jgi:hypothetical protein